MTAAGPDDPRDAPPEPVGVQDRPCVVLEPGDSLDQALREFRRRCEKAGIRSEVKRRQHARSPGERRRMKGRVARARARRRARRAARHAGVED